MTDEAGAERVGAGWAEATAAAAEQEMVAWRQAHPRPTLTELEQVTAGVAQRLQRTLLEGLTAELAAEPAAQARPACPRCRTPMERRGRKVREVLVAHQPTPLRLVRPYFVCPAVFVNPVWPTSLRGSGPPPGGS